MESTWPGIRVREFTINGLALAALLVALMQLWTSVTSTALTNWSIFDRLAFHGGMDDYLSGLVLAAAYLLVTAVNEGGSTFRFARVATAVSSAWLVALSILSAIYGLTRQGQGDIDAAARMGAVLIQVPHALLGALALWFIWKSWPARYEQLALSRRRRQRD